MWHDPRTSSVRIPIRFGRLRPLLAMVGLAPRGAYLDVGSDLVRVRMGWAFRAEIPPCSIRDARRAPNALSIGVHGLRGRWLVNGASGPLVALSIEPHAPARVCGVSIRLRELTVSVDDPDGVIDELSPAPAASS